MFTATGVAVSAYKHVHLTKIKTDRLYETVTSLSFANIISFNVYLLLKLLKIESEK